jgi:hypothetical protein
MADKAKHAFGTLEGIDAALSAGKIDNFDILFVKNADGKPFVGWIDRDGNKVIVDDSAEFAALEAEIATKVGSEEVEAAIATKADAADVESLESQLATKANSSDVTELEAEVATKVDAATVKTMIDEATMGLIEVVEF